jgi:hypothetical protein
MAESRRPFLPRTQAVIEEFIPICHTLAGKQRFAISVGGSHGKDTWDGESDIDLRLFTDQKLPWLDTEPERWTEYLAALKRWGDKGVIIDGVWCRTVGEIDSLLDSWIDGESKTLDYIWTIWGYHVLPDIYHQATIEDPYQIIAGWKQRLSSYPPKLKKAILAKNVESLRYWRGDYHYAHKVSRGDCVFLAGMSAKLVHEVIQILFALNETYFVGDGSNLKFIEKFAIKPPEFAAKVEQILYPAAPDAYERQYKVLCGLIDEIVALV